MSDTTLPSIPHGCTNPGERRVWLLATAAAGGAAALATAVPFVSTFAPSERAKAMGAAVTVDIGDLPPGGMKTVEWRGKPVWILRRTPEMLAGLPRHEAQLADPASAKDDLPSAPPAGTCVGEQPRCVQMPTATKISGWIERCALRA